MNAVPAIRIRVANACPVRPRGDIVVYWMIAARRARYSFGLQRAIEWCAELDRPLLVLEPLRCGYRWASARLHRFVLDGMADNARRFEGAGVLYHPYVEPAAGHGKGLLAALAARACVVVTDDFPCFFLPRMVAAAARQLPVRLEAVDGNGLLPLRAADRVFTTARSFRLFLQRTLAPHLADRPAPDPLSGAALPRRAALPRDIARRWPRAAGSLLQGDPTALAALPIDPTVGSAPIAGGAAAGEAALEHFVARRLDHYPEQRDHPDRGGGSGLSPYLHFGHLSAHAVFDRIARRERWTPSRLAAKATGSREGFWGMRPPAEAFLEQLVTWREIGLNRCALQDDYAEYASLPDWALRTLGKHAADPRPHVYPLAELAAAATQDEVWNAAQRQLVREGRIDNYLRMLWGKKILEWSRTPQEALLAMIALNDRYALDGRDPSSYSGIFWVLGRYDRAWGPERSIFGIVRYMSSESAVRKLRMKTYLERFSR